MRHIVYTVRHSVVPIYFSLPTVTLYSLVRTTIFCSDTKFSAHLTTLYPTSTVFGFSKKGLEEWILKPQNICSFIGFIDKDFNVMYFLCNIVKFTHVGVNLFTLVCSSWWPCWSKRVADCMINSFVVCLLTILDFCWFKTQRTWTVLKLVRTFLIYLRYVTLPHDSLHTRGVYHRLEGSFLFSCSLLSIIMSGLFQQLSSFSF